MKRWITLIYTTMEFSLWLRYQDEVKHKNQLDEIIVTFIKKISKHPFKELKKKTVRK